MSRLIGMADTPGEKVPPVEIPDTRAEKPAFFGILPVSADAQGAHFSHQCPRVISP
jgi:hypothetical protein